MGWLFYIRGPNKRSMKRWCLLFVVEKLNIVTGQSDLFALRTAHCMRRTSLVVLGSHLLRTSCSRIHIWQICYFTSWRAHPSFLSIWAVSCLGSRSLRLGTRGQCLAIACSRSLVALLLLLPLGLGDLLVMLLCDSVHDASYLQILWVCEFAQNGLQLGPLNQTGQLEVVLGTRLKIAVLKACVFD